MTDHDSNDQLPETWGSVQGEIIERSLVRDETGLAAIVVDETGAEFRIRGDGERFASMIEAAAARGEPVIFRGHVMKSEVDGSDHLSVRLEEPAELRGIVSRLIRSGEGESLRLGFLLRNELTPDDGGSYTIGAGVNVYGAAAAALSDLKDGDRVSLQGRDGPEGYIAISPVKVIPADPEQTDEPSM